MVSDGQERLLLLLLHDTYNLCDCMEDWLEGRTDGRAFPPELR